MDIVTGNQSPGNSSARTFDEAKAMVFRISIVLVASLGLLVAFAVYAIMLLSKAFQKAPYKLMISMGINDTVLLVTFIYIVVMNVRPDPRGANMAGAVVEAFATNFQLHIMTIGVNRVVYTAFPAYKQALFARGGRVYLWIGACWMATAVMMLLHAFPQTRSGWSWHPEKCGFAVDVHQQAAMAWSVFVTSQLLVAVVVLFVLYTWIGIKVLKSASAAHPISMREIRLNLQQALVFCIYLVPTATWLVKTLLHKKHIDSCSLSYVTNFLFFLNFVTNPLVYLTFNSDLQNIVRKPFCNGNQIHAVTSIMGNSFALATEQRPISLVQVSIPGSHVPRHTKGNAGSFAGRFPQKARSVS